MNIDGKTKVIGVIGNPISHTASPAMHNAAFEYNKLNNIYIPIQVKHTDLETAIKAIRACSFIGYNVTIPYKESVIPLLDGLDPVASAIGAVNTIVNKNGKLIGYNTDGEGFILSLKKELNFSFKNTTVTIIGAGGTAKALSFSLLKQPISKLNICNRTLAKTHTLKENLVKHTSIPIHTFPISDQIIRNVLKESTLVINCTPVGMEKDKACPIPMDGWITNEHTVYDVIYKPSMTSFLKQAKDKGATTLNGSGLLAGQGVLAYKLFTGQKIDYSFLKKQIPV